MRAPTPRKRFLPRSSLSVDPNSHSDCVRSGHRHVRLYFVGSSKTGNDCRSVASGNHKHVESIAMHKRVQTPMKTCARAHIITLNSTQTWTYAHVQTISGDLMPTVLLENLFRYASMRAQFRNSRLDVIHQSLNGIGQRPSLTPCSTLSFSPSLPYSMQATSFSLVCSLSRNPPATTWTCLMRAIS